MATKGRSASGFDWVLLGAYLMLTLIGLAMVYTTTYHDYASQGMWDWNTPFGRQLIWAGVSLLALFFMSLIDWQVWNTLSLPIYIVSLLVLVLLLFIGTVIKGAQSWLMIGPFSVQPSEFSKIATILLSASLLSSVRIRLSERRSQLIMLGVITAPALLIILQPDPGSAITFSSLLILAYRRGLSSTYYFAMISVFFTLVLSLMYGFIAVASFIFLIGILFVLNFKASRYQSYMLVVTLILLNILTYQYGVVYYSVLINAGVFLFHLWRYNNQRDVRSKAFPLVNLLGLCALSFMSFYAFTRVLKPHQQDRINVWLQPEKCDPRGSLYNLLQSKLAIGSGGITGKGFLKGTLTKLNYVPEQTTDFIFSSIGEEQGFLGSALVVILFVFLVMRIIRIGERSKHTFVLCTAYGIAGFIFFHFFINIGMTMGLSPVIGIPLPFISKGGSALLSFSIMIGIMLNMSRAR